MLASTDKPVLAFGRIAQNASEISRKYQNETGVPFIHGLPETVRALQGLVRYAAALRRGAAAMPEPRGRAENLEGAAFDALLASHGLTVPKSALGKTPDEAAAHAARIGFPVAVKIVSPEASHKTEVGGVTLGLARRGGGARRGRSDGRAARRARSARAHRRLPGAGDGRRASR